jgi:cytochrome c biogenesis protein CcdA
MLELLAVLLPIVVTDALNPVLAATVIFALGTPRPYRAVLWVLSGWSIVYFVAGIGLTTGLERIIEALASPRPADFIIQTAIALGLIWFAYRSARSGENPRTSRPIPIPASSTHTLGAFSGLLLGATINLMGLPFALPYFAALDQILKADLDLGTTLLVLAAYNLAYVLPFAALAVLRFMYRDRANILFERVNSWMERVSAVVLPLMLFLLGAVLIVDTVLYFATGRPLIDIGPPAN